MKKFPAIFEIDPATLEATDSVHIFCSEVCLDRYEEDGGVIGPYTEEESELTMGGQHCEYCGNPLDSE